MKLIQPKKYSLLVQLLISISLICVISIFCFISKQFLGYQIVAFILLMAVSILAMLFDIIPVLIAAILSALIWNFFFIPPLFTFHIDKTEDVLMFLMYFIVALVNAVLTFKIREQEKIARDKEEKENTIKLYNTLLNSLSHELRTPISTIIASIDTLKENENSITKYQQTDIYNEIEIASVRLNRQVENLLNISRLESGIFKPKFEWYDVIEIINYAIQKLRENNYSNIIEIEYDKNIPLIKIDSMMFEQIITNILHNAIIYNNENTKINIHVSVKNEILKIEIADDGIGFPENEIEFIFNKFYRINNSKTGGTGIGLSIVKGYVNALNGVVLAKNNSPKGAIFKIEFPCEISYINVLKNE